MKTYRSTKSLRDYLVHNKQPCKRNGTFRCGGCAYCRYMLVGSNHRLPNGQKYKPLHFCKTAGVVYLLTCPMRLSLYKKKKKRYWSFITEPTGIKTSDLPLGRHVCDFHQGIFPSIRFLLLDWRRIVSTGMDPM